MASAKAHARSRGSWRWPTPGASPIMGSGAEQKGLKAPQRPKGREANTAMSSQRSKLMTRRIASCSVERVTLRIPHHRWLDPKATHHRPSLTPSRADPPRGTLMAWDVAQRVTRRWMVPLLHLQVRRGNQICRPVTFWYNERATNGDLGPGFRHGRPVARAPRLTLATTWGALRRAHGGAGRTRAYRPHHHGVVVPAGAWCLHAGPHA
mmetsp:Transcript_35537/g.92914  ORF Transcript_35537/g.92914 Transcript_35537/m.92914 type:complete len:208 (-) Transcript_35537:3166-3789(-)